MALGDIPLFDFPPSGIKCVKDNYSEILETVPFSERFKGLKERLNELDKTIRGELHIILKPGEDFNSAKDRLFYLAYDLDITQEDELEEAEQNYDKDAREIWIEDVIMYELDSYEKYGINWNNIAQMYIIDKNQKRIDLTEDTFKEYRELHKKITEEYEARSRKAEEICKERGLEKFEFEIDHEQAKLSEIWFATRLLTPAEICNSTLAKYNMTLADARKYLKDRGYRGRTELREE